MVGSPRPTADLVLLSVQDKVGPQSQRVTPPAKVVSWHMLTVGHKWQGREPQEKS